MLVVGMGVFNYGHGHRAEKWRTVGPKTDVLRAESDVRAKMQH